MYRKKIIWPFITLHCSISHCHHIRYLFYWVLHSLCSMWTKQTYQHISRSRSRRVWQCKKQTAFATYTCVRISPSLNLSFIQSLNAYTLHTNNNRSDLDYANTPLRVHKLTHLVWLALFGFATVTHYTRWCWKVQLCIHYTLLRYTRSGYMCCVLCTMWHFVKTMPKKENRKSQTFQGQTCACNNSWTRRLDNSAMYSSMYGRV